MKFIVTLNMILANFDALTKKLGHEHEILSDSCLMHDFRCSTVQGLCCRILCSDLGFTLDSKMKSFYKQGVSLITLFKPVWR